MSHEDPARTIPLLAEHRSSGEYVLQSARMVGDEDDHAIWSQSCRLWRARTAETIAEHFPLHRAALADASRQPQGLADWKQQYEAEMRSVRAVLSLLDSIANSVRERDGVAEGSLAGVYSARFVGRGQGVSAAA
jgi:hypothetical protein